MTVILTNLHAVDVGSSNKEELFFTETFLENIYRALPRAQDHKVDCVTEIQIEFVAAKAAKEGNGASFVNEAKRRLLGRNQNDDSLRYWVARYCCGRYHVDHPE